ncbi:hypothetical protein ABPG75_003724 [Micractinium tetrahymenae]
MSGTLLQPAAAAAGQAQAQSSLHGRSEQRCALYGAHGCHAARRTALRPRRRSSAAAASASNSPAAASNGDRPAPLTPDVTAASILAGFEGADGTGSKQLRDFCEVAYLSGRSHLVSQHFPGALGADDFLARLEIALFAYGFSGDNSIAMLNLCRDEITHTLKHKIDSLFGSSFNTNGLGGVLTCGVSGVAAGLSHAPVSPSSGKERYVFFSFPHISIDARGTVGAISRPGRPGESCACGALQKALLDIRRDGLTSNCKIPGVHDARDPEFSILKQRIARRLRFEGASEETVGRLTLVDLTQVAERTITDDLEYLISQTVDPSRADYAVVTGVQVHSWGSQFDDDSPNLEFVAPTSVYCVVNGQKAHLDISAMPSLTPRQVRLLARAGARGSSAAQAREEEVVCNQGGPGTVREEDPPYLYSSREMKRRQRERADTYAVLLAQEGLSAQLSCAWPAWQSTLLAGAPHRDEQDTSVVIDSQFESDDELDEMWAKLQDKYLMQEMPDAAPNGGSAQPTPPEGINNSGSASSLSTPLPAAADAVVDEAAPQRMGLLSRLLRSMNDAKERRRQQGKGSSQ